MPRHTHPRPRAKHSRAHVREQRARKFVSRWKLAKALHDDGHVLHPEEVRKMARAEGYRRPGLNDRKLYAAEFEHAQWWQRDPWFSWPFYLHPSQFIDNMATGRACSCMLCVGERKALGSGVFRRRERNRWQAIEDVAEHGGTMVGRERRSPSY